MLKLALFLSTESSNVFYDGSDLQSGPGAYLGGGGIGPWSPLWVARIAKLHSKVSKIEAWPPPLCKLGIRLSGFWLEI